jgi:hypothetical protein
MSERNSPTDSVDEHSDTQTPLADTIQTAQDIIEALEEDVPVDALGPPETVDDDIEALEDALEHTDPESGDLPEGFEADVQSAQDDIQSLQETLNVAGADREVIARAEDLDDTVEAVELSGGFVTVCYLLGIDERGFDTLLKVGGSMF